MDSQKTFEVLHYCQENFEHCEIYQKNRPAMKESSDPAISNEEVVRKNGSTKQKEGSTEG